MSEVRILADGLMLPGMVGIPALEGWIRAGAPALPGSTVELPEGRVPPKLKRRITRLSAMAFCTGTEALERAGLPGEQAPLVWATANGEINTIGRIMDDLLGERGKVSPSQFHNSVYNAPTGYWGIATGRRFPSTTVSRGWLSFEYGLLEAWTRLQTGTRDVLLVAGDEAIEVPQWADPAHCTIDLCGSLLLSTREDRPALARITAVLHARASNQATVLERIHEWSSEHDTQVMVSDHRWEGVRCKPEPLGDFRNPCSGLLSLLRFLHAPVPSDTVVRGGRSLLLTRSDQDHDVLGVVVERP